MNNANHKKTEDGVNMLKETGKKVKEMDLMRWVVRVVPREVAGSAEAPTTPRTAPRARRRATTATTATRRARARLARTRASRKAKARASRGKARAQEKDRGQVAGNAEAHIMQAGAQRAQAEACPRMP